VYLLGAVASLAPAVAAPFRSDWLRPERPVTGPRLALPEDVRRRLDRIDQHLRGGEWEKARALADRSVEAIQRDRRVRWNGLAESLARLALAEAGLGHEDDALWHWMMAQNLDRRVMSADDLKAFGGAGALLDSRRLREPGQVPPSFGPRLEDRQGQSVEKVRKLAGDLPWPMHGLRELSIPAWLRAEVVIDAEGRVREPVVLSTSAPFLAVEVLEELRTWRFEPAKVDGVPMAVLYDLNVNAPSETPLAEMAPLTKPLADLEQMLRAGRWDEAHARAGRLWSSWLDRSQQDAGALAVLLTFRALAEAGRGETDSAVCRWQAAQNLEPLLFHADLSAYGAPGELLEGRRWGTDNTGVVPKGSPEPPVVRTRTLPLYPQLLQAQGVEERVEVEAILDATGAVREPMIVGGRSASHNLNASALDTLCDWRFQPAVLAGQPVPVLYHLTINYEIER
jgi:TonB family protein